jgi:uncharacterized protein
VPITAWPKTLRHDERAALRALCDWLRTQFGSRLVDLRLFGSRARGEGHEFSDLDVLVVVQDMTSDDRWAIWRRSGELDMEHEVTLSTCTLSAAR